MCITSKANQFIIVFLYGQINMKVDILVEL